MAGMIWALFEYDFWQSTASIIYIFATFFIFLLCCLPLMLGSRLFLSFIDKYWLNYLHKRFPQAEFINYPVDSRRTHGISTVIMQVRGKLDFEECKRYFQELIEKTDAKSNLAYPRLRQKLIIRCGRFAWMNIDNFKIENNVILANPFFRARPVTIHNIQEYASELASKYLSSDHPPWQVTFIPTVSESHYFILARVHDVLLLSGPNLAQLLLFEKEESIHWRPLHEDDENLPSEIKFSFDSHPLVQSQKSFITLQQIFILFLKNLQMKKEQFIYKYDPLYNKKLSKSLHTFICRLLLATCRTLQSISWRIWLLPKSFLQHSDHLQLSFSYLISSLLGTPKSLIYESLSWIWWIFVTIFIRIPMFIIGMMITSCLNYGTDNLVKSPGKIKFFINLCKELYSLLKLLITAPGYILDELILSTPGDDHYLQNISMSGRKMIAWSELISLDNIIKAACTSSINCSETEILFAATAGALHEYFHLFHFKYPIPESLAIIARAIDMSSILGNQNNKDTTGLVCLRLPIGSGMQDFNKLLRTTCESINRARSRQEALYLLTAMEYKKGFLTSLLPSLLKRVGINYFTKRYAVRVTDLLNGGQTLRRNNLGQTVEMFLYWPPPQANTCLSLGLLRYGHHVRLTVMADSQCTPEHNIIVNSWPKQLQSVVSSQRN